jgi:hypothetical protein
MLVELIMDGIKGVLIGLMRLFPSVDVLPSGFRMSLVGLNRLVPWEDIFSALGIVLGLVSALSVAFVVNWIIKRIRGG